MRGTLSGIVGSGRALAAAASLTAALASAVFAQTPAPPQSQAPAPRESQTPARPQSQTPARRQARTRGDADASADLSITARVTADSLRFEKVPNTRVEFTGRPERKTVWEADRENLPPEVRPGVTYRDIGITLRITSVFADIDRIVAEALGEIPASDDARPATPRPPAANSRPQTPAANTPPQTPSTDTTPPSDNTPPATDAPPSVSTTPPAQTQANAAATQQQRRRAHARRGRAN